MYGIYQKKLYQKSNTQLSVSPSTSIIQKPSQTATIVTSKFTPLSLTTKERVTWKTFSHVAGYSFRYPSSLTPSAKAPGIGLVAAKPTSDQVYIGPITITTLPDLLPAYNYKDWSKENITVGNIKATHYFIADKSNTYREFYFFSLPQKNRNVQVSIVVNSASDEQLINKVITSFTLHN